MAVRDRPGCGVDVADQSVQQPIFAFPSPSSPGWDGVGCMVPLLKASWQCKDNPTSTTDPRLPSLSFLSGWDGVG